MAHDQIASRGVLFEVHQWNAERMRQAEAFVKRNADNHSVAFKVRDSRLEAARCRHNCDQLERLMGFGNGGKAR